MAARRLSPEKSCHLNVLNGIRYRLRLADDSPTIRKALCGMLGRDAEYVVYAAENGQQAIDLAVQHRPDLIILDLSMPVINGLNASLRLKAIVPDVPIILFTQYADLGHNLFPDGSSIDRIVPKNEAHRLMGLVREFLSRTTTSRNTGPSRLYGAESS
jgi:CheY-like chemotaxis protein